MSLGASVGLGVAAARIVGLWAREQVASKRPVRPGEVPATPARLSNEWLTDALCGEHRDAHVVGFELGGGSDGTSARRQLTVAYETPAGLQACRPRCTRSRVRRCRPGSSAA